MAVQNKPDDVDNLVNDILIRSYECGSQACPDSEVSWPADSINLKRTTARVYMMAESMHQGVGVNSLVFYFTMAERHHTQYRKQMTAGQVMQALHKLRVEDSPNDIVEWNKNQLEACRLFILAYLMAQDFRQAHGNTHGFGLSQKMVTDFQLMNAKPASWKSYVTAQGLHAMEVA